MHSLRFSMLLFLASPLAMANSLPLIPDNAVLRDINLEAAAQRVYEYEYIAQPQTSDDGVRLATVSGIQTAGTLSIRLEDVATGRVLCQEEVREEYGVTCFGKVTPGKAKRVRVSLQAGTAPVKIGDIHHMSSHQGVLNRFYIHNGQAVDENPLRSTAGVFQHPNEIFGEFELNTPRDVTLHTWGGKGRINMQVWTQDFAEKHCDVKGDMWQACDLRGLPAGKYRVYLQGDVGKVNFIARW